jgi:hypothetical protein
MTYSIHHVEDASPSETQIEGLQALMKVCVVASKMQEQSLHGWRESRKSETTVFNGGSRELGKLRATKVRWTGLSKRLPHPSHGGSGSWEVRYITPSTCSLSGFLSSTYSSSSPKDKTFLDMSARFVESGCHPTHVWKTLLLPRNVQKSEDEL